MRLINWRKNLEILSRWVSLSRFCVFTFSSLQLSFNLKGEESERIFRALLYYSSFYYFQRLLLAISSQWQKFKERNQCENCPQNVFQERETIHSRGKDSVWVTMKTSSSLSLTVSSLSLFLLFRIRFSLVQPWNDTQLGRDSNNETIVQLTITAGHLISFNQFKVQKQSFLTKGLEWDLIMDRKNMKNLQLW